MNVKNMFTGAATLMSAAALVASAIWIARAPQAPVYPARHGGEICPVLDHLAQRMQPNDPFAADAIRRTLVKTTSRNCMYQDNQNAPYPVQGPEYSARAEICVSNWTKHNGQTAIVFAHELAHVIVVYRAGNSEHNHALYMSAGRILSRVLDAAEVGTLGKARIRAYYGIGAILAPFTAAF